MTLRSAAHPRRALASYLQVNAFCAYGIIVKLSIYRLYLLVVSRRESNDHTQKRSLPHECYPDNLTDYATAINVGCTCSVTARLATDEVLPTGINIVIGDGAQIGGFYNAPLIAGFQYASHVGLEVEVKHKVGHESSVS